MNSESADRPAVAILCGGLGTRLRNAVADRPKALAQVAGRPFLAWLLDLLDGHAFCRVVLCTGYQGEQIEAAFGPAYKNLRLYYSREPSLVGTGGALRRALPLLESPSILIINGDSYCAVDLERFWRGHLASRAGASMVLTQVMDSSRFGSVQLDSDGLVSSFQEKTSSVGPGWINAGIYLASHALLDAIPENTVCSLERDIFPTWIRQGLRGVKSQGPFVDIGTPESYASADRLLRGFVGTQLQTSAAETTSTGAVA